MRNDAGSDADPADRRQPAVCHAACASAKMAMTSRQSSRSKWLRESTRVRAHARSTGLAGRRPSTAARWTWTALRRLDDRIVGERRLEQLLPYLVARSSRFASIDVSDTSSTGTACRRTNFRSSGRQCPRSASTWRTPGQTSARSGNARDPARERRMIGEGRGEERPSDHGRRISGSPSTTALLDSPERRARPARTFGGVAEWLGKGLQNPVHRFNSGPRLGPSGPSSSIEARTWALSSGVERFLDAEEVRGSNPLAPTRTSARVYLTHHKHGGARLASGAQHSVEKGP
jgi:hypothetical protein